MNDEQRRTVADVKRKIQAMLEERQGVSIGSTSVHLASKLWTDTCSSFDYMLDLPERHFERLRLHTYHLTGDNYQTYYFDMGRDALLSSFRTLASEVPPPYVLYEPPGGIGFDVAGHLVSSDTVRFQQVVNALYHNDVFALLSERPKPVRVLEIGAGYGGLAFQMSRLLPESCYVIVDLPETLLFSASYLSLHRPDKRAYIYSPGDDLGKTLRATPEEGEYDFILVPNYRLAALEEWAFDLAINVASFQEMRKSQVEEYLDFIVKTCKGVLFSSNQDAQGKNVELDNLSVMLKQRFRCVEVTPGGQTLEWRRRIADLLRSLARGLGLLDSPSVRQVQRPNHVYLCYPR